MKTTRQRSTATCPRHLVPWLVKERDLRRYLGRAFKACLKGRVVLFVHTYKQKCWLLSLALDKNHDALVEAAWINFQKGRYRKVVLANLPR
jgi:hypothetical protein